MPELPGSPWPAIEDGCPECGSNQFEGIEVAATHVALEYDDQGGIEVMDWFDVEESVCHVLKCRHCETSLIEDGDVLEVLQ